MTPDTSLRLAVLAALALGLPRILAENRPVADDPEVPALRVPEGFRIHRFADERLGVVKPTQIRFDGDGRLWVATTRTYPQVRPGEKADDRIVVLEDTDRDGVADRSHVFADGLHIPLGIELGDGGVYVGAADELLFLRDRDGDGRADERRVVFGGFGTGDTHQTLNTFVWGPSGELLMSQGLHAVSRIETVHGNVALHQAGVWRYWPVNGILEPFWDGAMGPHNPFGTVFDPSGRPLVFAGNGHGVYDLTPAMQPTDHFLLQSPVWSEGRKFAGADLADGAAWPEAHRGEYVAGGYLQNTVERFRITPSGSTVRAERLPPLVESTNTAFRVVDVRFGPDGALYLCDWFNPVIGHYQTSFRHPDRDKTRGRIWRVSGRDAGPIAAAPKLEGASAQSLLEGLLSEDRWIRLQSFRLLRGRSWDDVQPALRRWLTEVPGPEESLRRRAEAAGVLAAFDRPDAETVEALSRSTQPLHRLKAARLAGIWAGRIGDPLPLLTRLASDPEAQVRLETVVACSRVRHPEAVEVASIVTDHPMDPALTYAFTQCVHATRPSWTAAQAAGRLRFGDSPSRQSAFAKADSSERSARVAVERLGRIQEVALEPGTQWALADAVAAGGSPKDLGILLRPRTFTVGDRYFGDRHADVLRRLAADRRHRGVPSEGAAELLGSLLDSADPEVRAAASRLVGHWRVAPLAERLAKRAGAGTPSFLRAETLRALGEMAAPESKVILAEALGDRSDEVAGAAVEGLSVSDLGAAVEGFSRRIRQPAGPALTEGAFLTLLSHRDGAKALSGALTRSEPAATNRVALRAALACSGRNEPDLLKALGEPGAPRNGHGELAAEGEAQRRFLEEVASRGDSRRGRELFKRPDLGCASCHGVGASKPGLGPDFAALGTAQTPAFILGAILEPRREVKEGFTGWMVVLKDGSLHQGRLIREDRSEVEIFDAAERKELRLPRSGIEDAGPIGSIMPEGLVDALTREELRDLVAYLSGLGRRR